ncbi:putative mitochondrial hypothetical protein [Leptomonas pyrrhocoris]|uniref:Uncharacterized protein n=1 Tax=Leptomonas pyrrhocoris TaxID=157538 RepID=A0A0N1J535_LEPPY|nr:putative mitochondrial hypothetical protein [Leptomonas pyrrhocoris]KPA82964.1 putative mitochondrial hypothetical protein [Leptomonas pyrrhocoris]|eukprot:XP_015661403.1 putative mitochondrial hypothetical protein [Leptomonas pyrrhocoris]
MQRSISRLFQTGVHIPHGVRYNAAKIKNWPMQEVPQNFKFTNEQRFKTKAMPRDTGKIPRDFLLSVLYRNQPCEVSSLWEHCMNDPQIVLDSKRHLREVLQQARSEGFVSFEKDAVTERWVCHLTRERFEEVRAIVGARVENQDLYSGLRGASATETSTYSESFREMNAQTKKEHLRLLTEQVASTTAHLRKFQRMELDYLPYTDLNGKVNFMWWYETNDVRDVAALPEADADGDRKLGE